ncbi:hypothetical protein PPERSA_02278 [Pseudocohnilembus persalinus]|uniref:Transmembrane protein n=1 Tax=Pseudocohnilembus persalinus TaxID=266149 RepID=A0A0V0QKQ3_PSEPJ|nr:hypothetical protein PPERSA_02278 [Pseudocohnilembus persalinus]|eukprot:KRX02788.1 hypothetical protein PPERSA_02278 [Pseudocohnilembus persalinus]
MNEYSVPLENQAVPVPKMAFGFVEGIQLDHTNYDLRNFSFQFKMMRKYQDGTEKNKNYTLSNEYCDGLDWIGEPYNNTQHFTFLCPDSAHDGEYIMQGLLLSSAIQIYPRYTVNYCNNQTSLLFCREYQQLKEVTSGGRIYLFTKQENSRNWATGEEIADKQNFNLNYYFLVPGDYNRAELVMEYSVTTTKPDYLTSFSQKEYPGLDINSQNFYISDVTFFDPFAAFQIWLRLSDEVPRVDVVYDTIIDKVSEWGALWGVLFGAFAFYFLGYNTNKFYKKNEDWADFDKGLQKVDQALQRKSTINQDQQQIKQDSQNQQQQQEIDI